MTPPERVRFADVANCPERLAVIVPPLETTSPASANVPAALSKISEPAPMEDEEEHGVDVMELKSKAAFTLGESFKPLPKTKVRVPLLAGAALVSQFSPVVKLESAPPASQVSGNAGIETAPTASAIANHR